MSELIETDHLVAVLAGEPAPSDAALAGLRAATTGEVAAAELAGVAEFVIVQRLGALLRAQLRGSSLGLSVERRDGTLVIFGAPASGRWTTIVETDVLAVAIVETASGEAVWPVGQRTPGPVATSLQLANGRTIPVDRTMLIGRSPRVERVPSSELPILVPIADNAAVSRTHLKISVDGTRSVLEDLDSTNGTAIVPLGGVPHPLAPGELAELVDGMVVTIAQRVAFRVVLS